MRIRTHDMTYFKEQGWVTLVPCPFNDQLMLANYTPKAQYTNAWLEWPALLDCRGIVFNWLTGEVVCKPFRKFGNLGEPYAPSPDVLARYGEPEVTHKLDGSMVAAWWDGEQWRCTTRGSFTSPQAVRAQQILPQMPMDAAGFLTYVFEYIGPQNRVVVAYPKEMLVLIGVIMIDDGHELAHRLVQRHARALGVGMAPAEHPDDWTALGGQERDNFEGYVCFWPQQQVRVKVKLAQYVALHRMISGLSEWAVWDHLRQGKALASLKEALPEEFAAWVDGVGTRLLAAYDANAATLALVMADVRARHLDPTDRAQRKALAQFITEMCPPPLRAATFRAIDGKSYDDALWKLCEPKTAQPAFMTGEEVAG